jgi:LmbE family N-acetylglucosaminyl deacetylase
LKINMPSALGIATHADDIDFVMAGTLLRFKARGWDVHYFNLSTGNCGSVRHSDFCRQLDCHGCRATLRP